MNLSVTLSPVSTEISFLNYLVPIFFYSFGIELTNDSNSLAVKLDISDGPSINRPNGAVLDNWFFLNFILAEEPFAKALRVFGTCVWVNDKLHGKLVLPLAQPIKFDERFKVTSAPFLLQILTY